MYQVDAPFPMRRTIRKTRRIHILLLCSCLPAYNCSLHLHLEVSFSVIKHPSVFIVFKYCVEINIYVNSCTVSTVVILGAYKNRDEHTSNLARVANFFIIFVSGFPTFYLQNSYIQLFGINCLELHILISFLICLMRLKRLSSLCLES